MNEQWSIWKGFKKSRRRAKEMEVFQVDNLLAHEQLKQRPYLEFLSMPSLSMGIYQLKVGQQDRQQPHTEDEVYYVLQGKARFRSGDQEIDVVPGSVMFVERLAVHRFFDIAEDLTVLVFFAPQEGSLKGKA
jgi:mannose-6-phosphate isomerase-like protein (cupin superfamily)